MHKTKSNALKTKIRFLDSIIQTIGETLLLDEDDDTTEIIETVDGIYGIYISLVKNTNPEDELEWDLDEMLIRKDDDSDVVDIKFVRDKGEKENTFYTYLDTYFTLDVLEKALAELEKTLFEKEKDAKNKGDDDDDDDDFISSDEGDDDEDY